MLLNLVNQSKIDDLIIIFKIFIIFYITILSYIIVCDEEATLELHVKTVKYYKGLMDMYKAEHPDDPMGLQLVPYREF